jgi:hypothetical protein
MLMIITPLVFALLGNVFQTHFEKFVFQEKQKDTDTPSLTLHFCIVKDEESGYSQGRVDTYPIAFQAKCPCVNVSRLIDPMHQRCLICQGRVKPYDIDIARSGLTGIGVVSMA